MIAHDDCSEADPAAFFDSDSPTLRCPLMTNRDGHILEREVVIHNERRRTANRIPLNMNIVFSRDNAASLELNAVFQNDGRFTAAGDVRDVEPDVPLETHTIAYPNVICAGSRQLARMVQPKAFTDRSERIGPSQPKTAEFAGRAR